MAKPRNRMARLWRRSCAAVREINRLLDRTALKSLDFCKLLASAFTDVSADFAGLGDRLCQAGGKLCR